MTECVYCGNEIEGETPIFLGGAPLHEHCCRLYSAEMDDMDRSLDDHERFIPSLADLEAQARLEAEGEVWADQWDF